MGRRLLKQPGRFAVPGHAGLILHRGSTANSLPRSRRLHTGLEAGVWLGELCLTGMFTSRRERAVQAGTQTVPGPGPRTGLLGSGAGGDAGAQLLYIPVRAAGLRSAGRSFSLTAGMGGAKIGKRIIEEADFHEPYR